MLRRMLSVLCFAVAGVSIVAGGGCSSSSGGGSAPPDAASSQQIGAAGGSVTLPDGTGVTIPAGALVAGTTIDVTVQADPSAPGVPASLGTSVGAIYLFQPEGQQFLKPVTITLAFDPSQIPAGRSTAELVDFTAPAGTPSYSSLPTTVVDASHVAAQTTHFSDHGAGLPAVSDGGACEPADASSCNCVPLQPVTTNVQCLNAAPQETGGTIADGTYVLASTGIVGQTCTDNNPSQITVVVSGSSWQLAVGGPQEVGYADATATANGSSLQLAYGCCSLSSAECASTGFAAGNTMQFTYTATPTTLELATVPAGSVLQFQRQGVVQDGGADAGDDATVDASGDAAASADANSGSDAPAGVDGPFQEAASSDAPTSSDATPGDGGIGDASFACAQPADPATPVLDVASCASPPTPAGGTIEDGTYYLTSAVAYATDAGCPTLTGHSQGTVVVSGGEVSIVVVNGENPPGPPGWEISTVPTVGNSFGSNCICGTFSNCGDAGSPQPAQYTATGNTLLIFPSPNGVFTLTKQ